MATQATTESAYKLLLAECSDAIATSDWATAYSKLAQAGAVLSSFPRSTTGAAGNVTVLRQDLEAQRKLLDAAVASQRHSNTKRTMIARFGPGVR